MKLNTAKLAQGIMARGSSALSKQGFSFYSYSTRIAWEQGNTLFVNPIRYSVTTSKQMTFLKRYYRSKGFHIVDWSTGEVLG